MTITSLKRFFQAANDPKLVLKLAFFQEPFYMQFLALVLFVLLGRLGFTRWTLAFALPISMYSHEFAHAMVFRANKIKAYLGLIFPLGAIAFPRDKQEKEKSDKLHWFRISWMLQAGPFANLLLMFIGVLLSISGTWLTNFGKDLVLINGVLIVMNLLPLWKSDAAQLFHVIFSSLSEKDDTLLSILNTILVFGIIVFSLVYNSSMTFNDLLFRTIVKSPWTVLLIAVASGIWFAQSKDNPEHSKSIQAMSVSQCIVHMLAYYTNLVIALVLLGAF